MILYFLVHSDGEKFKIGIAESLRARLFTLKVTWQGFDLSRSLAVIGDDEIIPEFERTLHFMLDKWRLKDLEQGDGYTEWFDIECLPTAQRIMMQIITLRDVNKFEIVEPAALIRVRKTSTPPRLLSGNENRPVNRAVTFLRDALKNGRRPSDEIWQAAQQAGISHRAFNDAKKALAVESAKEGGKNGEKARWYLYSVAE